MLTIGIVVCDRDVGLLAHFMAGVRERVKCEHEVIVYDNTESEQLNIPQGVGQVLSPKGGKRNVRQFEARRQIAHAATGAYVWYVDPDDEVVGDVTDALFTLAIDSRADIVAFPVYRDDAKVDAHAPKSTWRGRAITVTRENFSDVWFALWDKWIKTSALREAFSLVEGAPSISCLEDCLIQALLFRKDSVQFFNMQRRLEKVDEAAAYIYRYHAAGSMAAGSGIHDGATAEAYITGLNTACGIMNKVFTEPEQRALFHGMRAEKALVTGAIYRIAIAIQENRDNAHEILTSALREVSAKEIAECFAVIRVNVKVEHLAEWAEIEKDAIEYMGDVVYDASDGDEGVHRSGESEGASGGGDIKPRRRVSFQLNTGCNLSCAYCGQGARRKRAEISEARLCHNFNVAMSKMERLLPEGFEPVILGGEPTLLSDWAAAKIIKRLEYYPRFFLLTNGTLPRSLWYLADNCYTLTHVTDWAKTMKAKSAGERDWVKIVVTRGDIDKLGAFLDKNGCERLEVSPSMGGGKEADLTAAECLRVSAIMQKHGMDALRIQGGPMMDINGLDDEQLASITACDGQNTEWAVDCSFDTEAVAAPCCMCFADAVPLSKFTGREKPSCKNCIGRMV